MHINKPLFICVRCRVTTLAYAMPEKLFGEWIMRCPECDAKNLVKTIAINKVELLTATVTGWCD